MIKPIPNTAQMEMFETADSTQVGGTHYKDMGMQPWEVMENVLTDEEFEGAMDIGRTERRFHSAA
jgi:hypothetical protein